MEGHAGDHVNLIRRTDLVPDGILELAPYTTIETVLNLGHLIGHIKGLGLHRAIAAARAVGTKMAAGVGATAITAFGDIHLIFLGNIRMETPTAASARAYMAAVQGISRPQGRKHRLVVKQSIVAFVVCVCRHNEVLFSFFG